MGRFPKIRKTGDKGVKTLGDIVEDDFGWLYRIQPLETDYGIDAHIEIVEDGEATGRLIGVQIKTGPSWFREEKEEGFIFRGDIEHYNYWTNHSLPVILVLCNDEDEKCYWVEVREENVEKISKSTWKILVPKKQILNSYSKYALENVAENKSSYEKKLDMLIVAKSWMKEIKKGNTVILESEEWVNKMSGRGSLTIKVVDEHTGEESVATDWPYINLPGWCYEDAFPKLFPWANISVDEDFYEYYDEQQYILENGCYNSEDDEWFYDAEDLQYYLDSLPSIRPYENCGEVAKYRLVLNLNGLGESFIKVDDYLRNQD